MLLESAFAATANASPQEFENFRRHVEPEWLEEALEKRKGSATVRKRRLPVLQVIWLVLGMALLRNRSIADVVSKLDLALPGPRGPTVAPSAVANSRKRLGEEPMEWLFHRCAREWAHESASNHRWHGLSLYGVDGTSLRVPDSIENRTEFGGHGAGAGRGQSGYPLVRLVALMALRSHLLAAVRFGPYKTGEGSYAKELWSAVPDDSLSILDRGFLAAGILIPLARNGKNRGWLTRAKSNTRWEVISQLGPGDDLVEMKVSREARRKDPSLPERWTVRAIRYERKGFRPQTLLTSLIDAQQYPATELIALYHERWELELGFDEVKTEILEREEAIRSRSPMTVRQEIWGVMMMYNLIRLEMEQVANEAKVEPTRISFVMALRLIQDEWLWSANSSPGAIPRHLRDLRKAIKDFILPPRREERLYPRAVKIKMSNYARKRPAAAAGALI